MKFRPIWAQAVEELRMTLERGETLLVTFGIPIVLLIFFAKVSVFSTGTLHGVAFVAPGILALAVMSSSMVSLGIATGFERSYGVLRRIGMTPLGRRALISAKILAIIKIEVLQMIILSAIAFGLGWHPGSRLPEAVAALILASIAFGGIGLLLAGTLRAEATLALANGLYVIFLLIGGIIFPLDKLGAFASFARLLPGAALTNILHPLLSGAHAPVSAWIILGVWAVLGPVSAARLFRFE
ncbi:MAG TPA: ABC transporter permease [Acidimicrobiales bacterium]|nr:ABC transporter permease [Acidimicrobiales bacterium]